MQPLDDTSLIISALVIGMFAGSMPWNWFWNAILFVINGLKPINTNKNITPASVDVKRGGNFASFCKICDAFYGQLEALVMHL